jgi:hypothetical protein
MANKQAILFLIVLVLSTSLVFANSADSNKLTAASNVVASSSGGSTGGVQTASNVIEKSAECEKYYICPDGSKVKYCELVVTENSAGCGCKEKPELLCKGTEKIVVVKPAEAAEKAKEAVKITPTVSTQSVCVANTELMNELDGLMKELKIAEEEQNKEKSAELMEKITAIKKQISEGTTTCKRITTASQNVEVVKIDKCAELKQWRNKLEVYQKLKEMDEETLKEKGYAGKVDIEKIIAELEAGIERLKNECENIENAASTATTTATQVTTAQASVAVAPVAADSGTEITSYYKKKMTSIMESASGTETKIIELKQLRKEIDNLIEELIKSNDEIDISDMKGVVEEIKINPGKIVADNVAVSTIGKKIRANISGSQIEIEPLENNVMMRSGNIEVNTNNLTVSTGGLKIENVEVKVPPSTAVAKTNAEIRNVKLAVEGDKAVYTVRADEKRKLFAIIPVNVGKEIKVDAGSENAEILQEKSSWWAFLTTS